MSEADKLFEKIGFNKNKENDVEVEYNYKAYLLGDELLHTILFSKVDKIIFSKYKLTNETMGIGIEELKAINLKCKELGWIEE